MCSVALVESADFSLIFVGDIIGRCAVIGYVGVATVTVIVCEGAENGYFVDGDCAGVVQPELAAALKNFMVW